MTIEASKGNKTRRIPILKDHVKVWESWLSTREAYGTNHVYVFFTSRGPAGYKSIYNMFRSMSEKVFGDKEDKYFTPHTLRYTYATKLWRGKVDLYVISKMLGHTSIKTTEKYLRVQEQELFARYIQEASAVL